MKGVYFFILVSSRIIRIISSLYGRKAVEGDVNFFTKRILQYFSACIVFQKMPEICRFCSFDYYRGINNPDGITMQKNVVRITRCIVNNDIMNKNVVTLKLYFSSSGLNLSSSFNSFFKISVIVSSNASSFPHHVIGCSLQEKKFLSFFRFLSIISVFLCTRWRVARITNLEETSQPFSFSQYLCQLSF